MYWLYPQHVATLWQAHSLLDPDRVPFEGDHCEGARVLRSSYPGVGSLLILLFVPKNRMNRLIGSATISIPLGDKIH